MQPEDVTQRLLSQATYQRRKPIAPTRKLSPIQLALLAKLDGATMGYISNTLTYSRVVYGAADRNRMLGLIAGGHLRVWLVPGPAPEDCVDRYGRDTNLHFRFERSGEN